MVHDPTVAIRDILREVQFLTMLTATFPLETFRTDPAAFRAAAFSIQSISEAVRHIPDDWLADIPNEPWSAIRATGNKIRHEYFRIDNEILWRITPLDAPALTTVMERMLARHARDQ